MVVDIFYFTDINAVQNRGRQYEDRCLPDAIVPPPPLPQIR